MANADLLAAINAAVDTETPDTKETETNDDADDAGLEGEETVDGAGDETGDEDNGGDEGDGDAEETDGDGAEGEEEVPGEDAGTDGKAGDAGKSAPGSKPAAGQAPVAKDHLNDPIDPRLKEATRERITGLIDIAKQQTTRAEAAETQFNEVMGYIQQSTASPEQYGQALDYIRAVNSGDRNTMEQAWNFMVGEMQALGRMLGKDVPGLDYLAAHPDLKAAVAAGQVTEAVAKETARLRDGQAQRTQIDQQNRQAQQTNEQRAAILNQGKTELNTLGAQLRAANPAEYAAKSKILTAALKGTFQQLDPRQWAAAYKRAYDNLVLPTAAKPATTTTPGKKSALPKNQPLRGGNPAGGAAAKPKSMFDAINMAIDEVPQR